MRTVARIQIKNTDNSDVYSKLFDVIQKWRDEKYELKGDEWVNRQFGGKADFSEDIQDEKDWSLYTIKSMHPVGKTMIQMEAKCLWFCESVYFICEIKAVDVSGAFLRPNITISAPKFMKQILADASIWRHAGGIDRVFAFPFQITKNGYHEFERLLLADKRKLPLVVISDDNQSISLPGLAETIAERGAGVCHVVNIDEDVSWNMTKNLGKEWSCFNGAVRVFWPRTVLSSNPRKHIIWMADKLNARVEEAPNPALTASNIILRDIFEASCYVPLPPELDEIEAHSVELRFRRARQELEDQKDYKRLAESYAKELDGLRKKINELQKEKRTAEENLQAILESNNEKLYLNNFENAEADEAISFDTVKAAVEYFRKNHEQSILFSDDLANQLDSINPSAGPPSKVYDYLIALKSLGDTLNQNGNLGTTVVKWLKDRNIDCSGESETKKAAGLFSFPVSGKSESFELHLKVNNATAPDRCIRIYFLVAPTQPFIHVGCIASKKYLGL